MRVAAEHLARSRALLARMATTLPAGRRLDVGPATGPRVSPPGMLGRPPGSELERSFSALRATQDCLAEGYACLRQAQQALLTARSWLDSLDLAPPRPAARLTRRALLDTIADAFEVTPREVVVDARLVSSAGWSPVPIQHWLQRRHGWDGSVAPYYLAHLHRLLASDED